MEQHLVSLLFFYDYYVCGAFHKLRFFICFITFLLQLYTLLKLHAKKMYLMNSVLFLARVLL